MSTKLTRMPIEDVDHLMGILRGRVTDINHDCMREVSKRPVTVEAPLLKELLLCTGGQVTFTHKRKPVEYTVHKTSLGVGVYNITLEKNDE